MEKLFVDAEKELKMRVTIPLTYNAGPFAFFTSGNNYLSAETGSSLQLLTRQAKFSVFIALINHQTARHHSCLV